MKNEAEFWKQIKPLLWSSKRYEEKFSDGTPDVQYATRRGCAGWLELKYIPELPATNARFPSKLQANQSVALERYHSRFEPAHLLLGVGPFWMLFAGTSVAVRDFEVKRDLAEWQGLADFHGTLSETGKQALLQALCAIQRQSVEDALRSILLEEKELNDE